MKLYYIAFATIALATKAQEFEYLKEIDEYVPEQTQEEEIEQIEELIDSMTDEQKVDFMIEHLERENEAEARQD